MWWPKGEIKGVRDEVKEQPMQILVRCSDPGGLAARLFQQDHMVEAKISRDRKACCCAPDADSFYLLLEPRDPGIGPGSGIHRAGG
jgi:ABC-2 type transport system ATP-binding protein